MTTGLGSRLPSLAIWIIGEASESEILKKRDTAPFRMRKRYLRRSTSKNGLYTRFTVITSATKPDSVSDVEMELAVRVPGLVREHQVDVVVEIAEVLRRAAREPQVHAVVDRFVAVIER